MEGGWSKGGENDKDFEYLGWLGCSTLIFLKCNRLDRNFSGWVHHGGIIYRRGRSRKCAVLKIASTPPPLQPKRLGQIG